MKIAVLGGSFNPIHIGHLALADDVCASLGYDRVLFVVALNPPHKEMEGAASAVERLEMVRLACEGDERFVPSSCEIDRGGVSYTYDTICSIERQYAQVLDGKVGLIMGDDLIAEFHLWHRAQELSQKCDLILARRPMVSEDDRFANRPLGAYGAHEVSDSRQTSSFRSDPLFADASVVDNPLLSISSTDIRMRIAEGKSFRYLVPSGVFKYISTGNLYGYK